MLWEIGIVGSQNLLPHFKLQHQGTLSIGFLTNQCLLLKASLPVGHHSLNEIADLDVT